MRKHCDIFRPRAGRRFFWDLDGVCTNSVGLCEEDEIVMNLGVESGIVEVSYTQLCEEWSDACLLFSILTIYWVSTFCSVATTCLYVERGNRRPTYDS